MARITVTSSLNEISTDPLRRVVGRVGGDGRCYYARTHAPLSSSGFWTEFKDDVNGISSSSDIYFMGKFMDTLLQTPKDQSGL